MAKANGGLMILKEMKDQLPPSERKIAEYILSDPEKAIQMTAVGIGEASHTSGAAVIRLCKSLSLGGLQELKLRIAGDLNGEVTEFNRDIEKNEDFDSIIHKITQLSMNTLRETEQILNLSELEKAVERILNAKSIHFFGVGASGIAAVDAQQKFTRINKHSTAYSDVHMATTLVANAGKDDVVVGISFSGETFEVKKIMELANANDVSTISITSFGKSSVANLADINLHTSPAKEATFRSGATSSRMAQLHVIDILFMCIASKMYDQAVDYLDSTRGAIASLHKSK
ncbi:MULTISPECIES: MurR/RpiR family transcriptional regulator [Allobacillus]|uniref:MurR/RpiR family transcriptional regulator n=1 Tax=Allobacillus salarius TaxID=1955272 RepID=A0A556P6J8_9BACI|nr:MurR/RpiR family transcriptional regulator [Allobacillus salarius]TSJ60015.1 MurR/RpiR family transcriptional regulator [Allobacillus salarius]